MRREELAHLLRAAARIAADGDILVVGSQAILGSFGEDELPDVAWLSVEADLAFLDERSGLEKADKVDGAIGELSQFHETYSYYAQGVDLTTAKLPNGWRERLIDFSRDDASPARARCLDKHDLVIAKLVAMREKDLAFATALIDAGLVDVDVLHQRVLALDCVAPAVAATRPGLVGRSGATPSMIIGDATWHHRLRKATDNSLQRRRTASCQARPR